MQHALRGDQLARRRREGRRDQTRRRQQQARGQAPPPQGRVLGQQREGRRHHQVQDPRLRRADAGDGAGRAVGKDGGVARVVLLEDAEGQRVSPDGRLDQHAAGEHEIGGFLVLGW